jgi:hypothetical protein
MVQRERITINYVNKSTLIVRTFKYMSNLNISCLKHLENASSNNDVDRYAMVRTVELDYNVMAYAQKTIFVYG